MTHPMHRFPASWVDEEDWIVLELSTSLYGDHIESKDGWSLLNKTNSVAAWVKGDQAIVGIMGTSAKTGLSNLLDDAALAGIVDDSCDLAVVNQAETIIESLADYRVIVAGHSLGGAAAFCVGHKGNVERAVAFNPGAPPTGGGLKGPMHSKAYHIVGDIISTHINDATTHCKRIHLHGDVRWNNVTYYHSTDRFFENKSYELWSAQKEQDSLVKYIYNQSPTTFLLTLVTGLLSKDLNKDRIREIVCKNPIPGTEANCPKIVNSGRTIATLAGGLIGGFFGGPVGLAAGARAGYALGSGTGLLDVVTPGAVGGFKRGVKRALQVGQAVNRTVNKRARIR